MMQTSTTDTKSWSDKKATNAPRFFGGSPGLLQRKCSCGQHTIAGTECTECNKNQQTLQRATGNSEIEARNPGSIPSIVHEVLRSPGQPLDANTRAFMEPRFGHDFSKVRVHSDARAAGSARAVNARAYTVGQNVVFAAGSFAPETTGGRQLLAHELTHTLQQDENSPDAQMASASRVSNPGDSYELEAEAQAARVVAGEPSAPVRPQVGLRVARVPQDSTQQPSGLPCVLTSGRGHVPGRDVMFRISSATLTPTQRVDIGNFVRDVWAAGGSTDDLIVDGWASVDGEQPFNRRLSCERTEAVKAELIARGVPASKVTTFAHGESTEFSTTDLTQNRRAIITTVGPSRIPPTPMPTTPTPTPPAAIITSETLATSPGARTRTTIGVGEEVDLSFSAGSTRWATFTPLGRIRGLLSNDAGDQVRLTAPDTAQTVTVKAGGATIAFTVIAPNRVHMDRFPGTGIKHTLNKPNSGIATLPFLLPDTVNFYNVQYRELDVLPLVSSGVYSCNPFSNGHCKQGGGGASCGDLGLSNTVVGGKGTQAVVGDCAYSGHCRTAPPFLPGVIIFAIPYEYKVGSGLFHPFFIVPQMHTLAADASTLTSDKMEAHGVTTVAAATNTIAGCR